MSSWNLLISCLSFPNDLYCVEWDVKPYSTQLIPDTATRGHSYCIFVPFAKIILEKSFLRIVLLNLGISCPLMLFISVH